MTNASHVRDRFAFIKSACLHQRHPRSNRSRMLARLRISLSTRPEREDSSQAPRRVVDTVIERSEADAEPEIEITPEMRAAAAAFGGSAETRAGRDGSRSSARRSGRRSRKGPRPLAGNAPDSKSSDQD